MSRRMCWAGSVTLLVALFVLLDGPSRITSLLGTDDEPPESGTLLESGTWAGDPTSPVAHARPPVLSTVGRGSIRGRVSVKPAGAARASIRLAGSDARGRSVDLTAAVQPDGTFELAALSPGSHYTVTVDAGHAARVISPVVVTADAETDIGTIEITATIAVAGTVCDEAHRAVPGAAVWLMPYRRGNHQAAHHLLRCNAVAETHTDEQGHFRFENVPADYYDLAAHKAGFCAATDTVAILDGRQRGGPERLVLRRSPLVRGRVVRHDGQPVRGAEVALYTRNTGGEGIGRTDSGGRFALPGRRQDWGNHIAVRAGRSSILIAEWPETGDLTVVVPPDARLTIRLLGAVDGRPRSGVVVQALIGYPEQPTQSLEGTTDQGGEVTLEAYAGLLDHAHILGHHGARPRIDDERTFTGPEGYVVFAGKHTVFEYRVPQPAQRVIRGRVTDRSGRPIPGAHCGLQTGRHWWAGHSTGAHGRYRLELDPKLDGVLEIHRPGYVRHYILLADVPGAEGRQVEYDVTLARGSTLVGRVIDGEGRPVAGARVIASVREIPANTGPRPRDPLGPIPPGIVLSRSRASVRNHWSAETVTADNGTYVVGGVLDDLEIEIGAKHVAFQSWRPVKLRTGTAPVQRVPPVRIHRGTTLRARVLLPNGNAANGVRVQVSRDIEQSRRAGTYITKRTRAGLGVSDASGLVRIDDLYNERVLIECTLHGTGGAKVTRTLVRGDGSALEIQLRAATRLAGRLLDERERPVAGVTVHVLVDERDAQHDEHVTYDHHELTSDAMGRFALDDLPPKPLVLSVEARGYKDVRMDVAGRQDLLIRLAPISAELRNRREVLERELAAIRRKAMANDGGISDGGHARLKAIQYELYEIEAAEAKQAPRAPPASGGGGIPCGAGKS